GAEAAVVRPGDEDQAARCGDRAADVRPAGVLLALRQVLSDAERRFPGDLAGVDVDGDQRAPWGFGAGDQIAGVVAHAEAALGPEVGVGALPAAGRVADEGG